ncbi:MAG TPA: bifunctional phosphopantothenoylcysteine decarboxylase/phosphopantothenate--cysteine ligase CoaBC [Candidatus Eisenbacteria bacterium]|nr:bifunctional phosphopantothenoylcysteine decarboxylase/phosphopantothenate--cysteine ligase CoaBC [Candidatus Eisenbacteria bacterium]
MMLRGRTVVVGVSGGIAAYKACELVRALRAQGAGVVVVMTPAAREFVTPLTFQALSGNPALTEAWGDQHPRFELPPASLARMRGAVLHVDLAEAADVIVLAPATADLIARLAHGETPDLVTDVVLAARRPIVVCPAMDLEMWRARATQDNVATLRARGFIVVGPDAGPLASGLTGPGRLASLDAMMAAIVRAEARPRSLAGARVLIGAGRTEEPLDPVRVLTNRSSGRMGFALAEAARDRGADVTLVHGPASVPPPEGVRRVPVTTAAQMAKALGAGAARAHVVVMAAAVADYRPARIAREKLKRVPGPITLELHPNPDILAGLAAHRRRGQQFVGFALETSRGLSRARAKLAAKGLDLIVLNAPEAGIGGDTNVVTLIDRRDVRRLPEMTKRDVAEVIIDRVIEMRAAAGRMTRGRKAAARASAPRRLPAARRATRRSR